MLCWDGDFEDTMQSVQAADDTSDIWCWRHYFNANQQPGSDSIRIHLKAHWCTSSLFFYRSVWHHIMPSLPQLWTLLTHSFPPPNVKVKKEKSNESRAERGSDTDSRSLKTSRGKWKNDQRGLSINGCSPGLLKRGIQASASEENQSMARPLSSALPPALKEKASSQGCAASGQENLGQSARLRVNMWHRSPAHLWKNYFGRPSSCKVSNIHSARTNANGDGPQTPKSSLQAFNSPYCEKNIHL